MSEVMNIITQARRERRTDLQEIADAHVGLAATSILLLQQARLGARLTDADPNSPVDVVLPGDESPDPTQPSGVTS